MFAQERLNAIRRIIRQQRRMSFSDLHRQVKVSPATLRRDLAELEEAGHIIRVHGGVLDSGYVRTEISFDERVVRNSSAKKAIAAMAALLVPASSTVLIDAGTTCLELGKALLQRKDVRLITHSVSLLEAAYLGDAPVVCLGGELRKVSGALTGGAALQALALIHADIAFIGATGLDSEQGCSTTELSEAEMKIALLARASRKVLLADGTKWQSPSTIRFAGWNDFHDWVTDQPPTGKDSRIFREAGVKIHSP